jgi:hypothetical protein
MIVRSNVRRPGLSMLEVVATAAVCIPGAAALYWLYEKVMNHYFFMLGSSVGMPGL